MLINNIRAFAEAATFLERNEGQHKKRMILNLWDLHALQALGIQCAGTLIHGGRVKDVSPQYINFTDTKYIGIYHFNFSTIVSMIGTLMLLYEPPTLN